MQCPSLVHGVSIQSLVAFMGAAMFFNLIAASLSVGTSLFIPAITITFYGPNSIALTLLLLPST